MEKVSQLASVIAAVAGIVAIALLVGLEKQRISEWELWDIWRRSYAEDAAILVAKLRNDREGRHTEDLLEWVRQQGKPYHELGRSWSGEEIGYEGGRKRDQALHRHQSLALVEGYVGAEGAIIRLWAKGARTREEMNFDQGKDDSGGLRELLEKAMVQGMSHEASQSGAQIAKDQEYQRLRTRAIQTRRQMTDAKRKEDADFVIAYVENIRADKKGEVEAQQAALAIYTRLLEQVDDVTERIPLLVNLGIAEFRTAKQEGSEVAAETALRRWRHAERIAAERGLIEAWAKVRTFQTEGELLLGQIRGDHGAHVMALKRQTETIQDTQGLLSEGAWLDARAWLIRADESWSQASTEEACVPSKDRARGGATVSKLGKCRAIGDVQWTEEEYRARELRTERWLAIARAAGHEFMAANLVGVRANLLRERGLRENDPGLLITSFEGTHEFRTRIGIIDKEVAPGQLIIGIPEVLGHVELEASLALACADVGYMRKLAQEIRTSELWCRRGNQEHCKARGDWRRNILSALEYGIASWETRMSEDAEAMEAPEDKTYDFWRHAVWVRNEGADLARTESLCPNRPQGIAESEEERENNKVNKRTRAYQKIQRTSKCILPRLSLTSAQSLPTNADPEQITEWRGAVETWINASRRRMQEDIRTIKACEGEPW